MNKKKTSIIMVGRSFYPTIGGYQTQALRLGNDLIEQGIDASIVTELYDKSLNTSEVMGKLPVRRISANWFLRKIKYVRKYLWVSWGLSLFCFLFRKRNDFNILYVYFTDKYSFVAVLCAKLLGKRIVMREGVAIRKRVSNRNKPRWNANWGGRFSRKTIVKSDIFVAVSRELSILLKNEGISEERIRYIPNGIPIEKPIKSDENTSGQNALITGRLSDNLKGVDILLKAWAIVISKFKDAHLTVLGDGPEKTKLEKQAKDLGVYKSVHFCGYKTNVKDYLAIANIFVFPSRGEGMPNALLEAMAFGLPCIATPVGGIPDIIRDGENGFLVPVEDHIMLANKIMYLFSSPEICNQIGYNAQKRIAKEFSSKKNCERYLSVFKELIN